MITVGIDDSGTRVIMYTCSEHGYGSTYNMPLAFAKHLIALLQASVDSLAEMGVEE